MRNLFQSNVVTFLITILIASCSSENRSSIQSHGKSAQAYQWPLKLASSDNPDRPVVIVGIDGPSDHGEVDAGVTDAVIDCYRKKRDCVVVIPERPEYRDPDGLCRELFPDDKRKFNDCLRDLTACFRENKCRVVSYKPDDPRSLPDILDGIENPIVVCHHVPTNDGSNPIWDCPCKPSDLGKLNPYWRCCFSKKCSETAGGGIPDTPHIDDVLKVDELPKSSKLPPR